MVGGSHLGPFLIKLRNTLIKLLNNLFLLTIFCTVALLNCSCSIPSDRSKGVGQTCVGKGTPTPGQCSIMRNQLFINFWSTFHQLEKLIKSWFFTWTESTFHQLFNRLEINFWTTLWTTFELIKSWWKVDFGPSRTRAPTRLRWISRKQEIRGSQLELMKSWWKVDLGPPAALVKINFSSTFYQLESCPNSCSKVDFQAIEKLMKSCSKVDEKLFWRGPLHLQG